RRPHAGGRGRGQIRRRVRRADRRDPLQARRAGARLTEHAELVERIWSRDATVWTGSDEARWLGWLDAPARGLEDVDLLLTLPDAVEGAIDDVVLLGMGGSSLAPEVLRQSFGAERFHVLDTTHPAAIRELQSRLDLERTL